MGPPAKGFDREMKKLGSASGSAAKAVRTASPRSNSELYEKFLDLKFTAEKLVRGQASLKADLKLAHTKLKKAVDQIHVLEEKLHKASNENIKLRAEQVEGSNSWNELQSVISSSKMLYAQFTEYFQCLAGQIRTVEDDKRLCEEALAENFVALRDLKMKLTDLSMQLESAYNTIKTDKEAMLELRHEKERLRRSFRDKISANECTIVEKDALIRQLEDDAIQNNAHLETLNYEIQQMQQDLMLKEEVCKCLRTTQEKLENEKTSLQYSNQNFAQRLNLSCQRRKEVEEFMQAQVAKVFSSFNNFYELAQKERNLILSSAKGKYEELERQVTRVTSEKDALHSNICKLKEKIIELQITQETILVQHVEESRLAEDKIRRLEHEAEQGLLQKASRLESENNELRDKAAKVLEEKIEEVETLQNETGEKKQHHDSLKSQICELRNALEHKTQLLLSSVKRERQLEAQRSEIQGSLAAAESKLTDARTQYDLMLEGKQLELSKHLKERSRRNNQECSVPSEKRAPHIEIENTMTSRSPGNKKDVMLRFSRSPLSSISNHSKRVICSEYEVESLDGAQEKMKNADILKGIGGLQQAPVNVGGLALKGPLNPYTDDPCAIDESSQPQI